jgi:hypothetical protein
VLDFFLDCFYPLDFNVFGGCHLLDFLRIRLGDVAYFGVCQCQRGFYVE